MKRFIQCFLMACGPFLMQGSSAYSSPLDIAESYTSDPNPVVLVPGILGSELTIGGERVWVGNNFFLKPELLAEFDNVHTNLLDFERLAAFGIEDVLYGKFSTPRKAAPGAVQDFFPFHYDWRRSNEVSAKRLSVFLCELARENPRPIILVGHSMGGLVVKHWLMDHYESPCPDGKRVNIGEVSFVATPHLGAPKAFLALTLGMDLFGVSKLERQLLYPINKFGYTFDSIYELLPFTTSRKDGSFCYSGSRKYGLMRGRIWYLEKYSYGVSPTLVDPFNFNQMAAFGVLSKIEALSQEIPEEVGYPGEYLREKLANANRIACKLASFKVPEELAGRDFYHAGDLMAADQNSSEASTASEIWVLSAPVRSLEQNEFLEGEVEGPHARQHYQIVAKRGPGDRTLPRDIALFYTPHSFQDSKRGKQYNQDHISILGDYIFNNTMEMRKYQDLASGSTGPAGADLFGSPIREISEMTAAQVKASQDYQVWTNFLAGTVDESGYIDPNRDAAEAVKLLDGMVETSGYQIRSPAVIAYLRGNIFSKASALEFATVSQTAEGWSFVASLGNLTADERIEASLKAAKIFATKGQRQEALDALSLVLASQEGATAASTDSITTARTGIAILRDYEGSKLVYLDSPDRPADTINVFDPEVWRDLDLEELYEVERIKTPLDPTRFEGKEFEPRH